MNELHLFAGAGGGILGGMLLGHTCVCAVEIEPYCRKVLLQRQRDGLLPLFPIWDDVRTFDGRPWRGKVDIVCGGFPCQDISCAGKGAGIDGARSGLWREFARVIREVRPKYAFVENSPMLAHRGLGRVLGDLAEIGYDAVWTVLGADDVGAPHIRKRMWILAPARHIGGRAGVKGTVRADGAGELQEEIRRDNAAEIARPSERAATIPDAELFGNGRREQLAQGEQAQGYSPDILPDTANQRTGILCKQSGSQGAQMRDVVFGKQCGLHNELCGWWQSDPADEDGAFKSGMGRVAYGVANRVDRLKAIGNGQVPLVAAVAFKFLTQQIEK